MDFSFTLLVDLGVNLSFITYDMILTRFRDGDGVRDYIKVPLLNEDESPFNEDESLSLTESTISLKMSRLRLRLIIFTALLAVLIYRLAFVVLFLRLFFYFSSLSLLKNSFTSLILYNIISLIFTLNQVLISFSY
jgi:hypothetical protein